MRKWLHDAFKRIIIESPYAGEVERNIEYARKCMIDSLKRNESPFLSHLLYTQVLDDEIPEERSIGISAGYEWWSATDKIVFYLDYGITPGMLKALNRAIEQKKEIEYRVICKPSRSNRHI